MVDDDIWTTERAAQRERPLERQHDMGGMNDGSRTLPNDIIKLHTARLQQRKDH